MKNVRLIARLDIKGSNLIKGVHLEGLRVIGDPQEHALKYYDDGADELIYIDVVASLYGRNNLTDIVERTANNVFVPITVGGGVRSVEDARKLLRCGADKVAVNTAAVERPHLLSELADVFGSQCVVLSVEAKQQADGRWIAFTDNGRENSGKDVIQWIEDANSLGIGEVLLTSIDKEGTNNGFDLALIKEASEVTNVPIIISGGMGKIEDIQSAIAFGADAVAMADVLHYKKMKLSDIHKQARDLGLHVRKVR